MMAQLRSDRLKLVEKVAKQREDKAAQAMELMKKQIEAEYQRLSDLQAYQNEYLESMRRIGTQISGQQIKNYEYFSGQLEFIVGQQQKQIQVFEQQLKDIEDKWRQLYLRRKSIGTIVEKFKLEEWLAEEKQQQKQMDELISQLQAKRDA